MSRANRLTLGLVLLAAPVAAQDAPKPSPDKTNPDIVVTGKADTQLDTLLKRLAPTKNDRQIARWDDHNLICTSVIGLWPERAAYLSGRIDRLAKSVGIEPDPAAKCRPNNIIVFTDAADKLAAKLIDRYPGLIQNVGTFGLPHRKLKAPYLAPRAVRWFSVRATESSGEPLSRIKLSTRENTVLSLILVDEPKLVGIKWAQLGDYLAMISLCQPELDTDYAGADSVLAIFAARDAGTPGPAGLTAQDRAFLAALYRSDPATRPDTQRDQIGRDLKKDPGK